jgi:hypothetical protein
MKKPSSHLSRRSWIGAVATGLVVGWVSTKIVDVVWKYSKKAVNALSGAPEIEDIIHGKVSPVVPLSLDESTDAIVSGMPGARRDIIYAIIKQERAAGQNDFFMGEQFWIDQYKPAILFERHVFFRCLQKYGLKTGKKDLANTLLRENPGLWDILSKNPTSRWKYGQSSDQYDRLRRAFDLGKKYPQLCEVIEDCALMSCSWWIAQMLWENYEQLWYTSVRDFVQVASKPETGGENFVRFAKSTGLHSRFRDLSLSDSDIRKIAQIQNGLYVRPEYIANLKKYMADSGMYSLHGDGTIPAAIGATAGVLVHAKTAKKSRRAFIAAGLSWAVGGILGRKII